MGGKRNGSAEKGRPIGLLPIDFVGIVGTEARNGRRGIRKGIVATEPTRLTPRAPGGGGGPFSRTSRP